MSIFFKTSQVELHQGNCLEVMPTLEPNSFDAIICDLPYGQVSCTWDKIIPFEPLWECYKRLIKPNGAIVLFASQPFTSELVMSNRKWFKYCWVWQKTQVTGFLNAGKQPLRSHEDIAVFYSQQPTYNPQHGKGTPYKVNRLHASENYGSQRSNKTLNQGNRHPTLIIDFPQYREVQHPTQKPVPLLQYLIKTYTNPGDRILDNTAGSFTTGVAAVLTGRKFTGIELLPEYCKIGQKRIEQALQEVESMLIKPWEIEENAPQIDASQLSLL